MHSYIPCLTDILPLGHAWSPVLIMGDGSTRAFFEASIKVELARQWNWQGCSVLGRLLAERSCNSGASGSEKVASKEMGLYKKNKTWRKLPPPKVICAS